MDKKETIIDRIKKSILNNKLKKTKLESIQEVAVKLWSNILENKDINKDLSSFNNTRQINAVVNNNKVILSLKCDVSQCFIKMFYENQSKNHGNIDITIPDCYYTTLSEMFDKTLSTNMEKNENIGNDIANSDLMAIVNDLNHNH